jgi:integrase
VITSRPQVSGTVPAVLGCMLGVAGFFVAGTLAESVASLVQPQTIKLPHREVANIHCAELVVASTPVTPSTASTGGKTVPRRRFQKGTLIVRGKKPVRCGVFREDVLQPSGAFERVQRTVVLGPVSSLSERAAWKLFQPYLDRVNSESVKMPPRTGMTLEQFVREWRTSVAVNLAATTARAMESHLRAHIIPKLGSLPLTEINTKNVQSFVAYLGNGRSRKTVENVLGTLSSLHETAKGWGYACGNFSQEHITMPRRGVKKDPRSFTDEEMGRVIAAAPEPCATIFSIAATLGLRVGETLALRVSDIDFTKKIIRIRQSVDAVTRKIQAVKSDASSADVPMPPQLEKQIKGYLASEHYHQNGLGLLFINKRGRPFNANKLMTQVLHPLLAKLGIERGGFHSMRHGTCSALLADGATPAVVQKQLRHSDPRITLGIYGHVIGDQQRDAVENRSARIGKFAVN